MKKETVVAPPLIANLLTSIQVGVYKEHISNVIVDFVRKTSYNKWKINA